MTTTPAQRIPKSEFMNDKRFTRCARILSLCALYAVGASALCARAAAGGGERGYDLFGGDSDRAVVEVMLAVEEAPMDATHGKARILKLEQLHTAVETRKVPEALLGAVFAFYVGQLRCRFTLPWKAVRKGLSAMAQHSPRHLWPACGSRGFCAHRWW